MTFRITIIVPCVVVHHLDPHTGIPFMPHMAAHLGGMIHRLGHDLTVIDCFGLQPHNRRIIDSFMLLGVDEDWVVEQLRGSCDLVFLYCRTVEDLISTQRLARRIKESCPDIKLCFFENTQSVNSFSLKALARELLADAGDAAVFGEPETRAESIVRGLLADADLLPSIAGFAYKDQRNVVVLTEDAAPDHQLDELPLPFWEKFPLQGYWIANFAHAPKEKKKFLPLLTSRGCPYRCSFCIAPITNPVWRARSPKNVVDEMEYFYKKMGIEEFHISDLDPTINDQRTQAFCQEIIDRGLPVTWKLAQGTKIETIKSKRTLELMSRAGCRFISFSPESGSPRLLKVMNKNVDFEHALQLTETMSGLGIKIQACFIAGVPGENDADRRLTLRLVRKLVAAGVDEIAVNIFTPLPGNQLWNAEAEGVHYSELTHSPAWRKDYAEVNRFRMRMYLTYFFWKLLWPRKILRELGSFLSLSFQTKMEMSIYKQLKIYLLYYVPSIFQIVDPDRTMAELKLVKRPMPVVLN